MNQDLIASARQALAAASFSHADLLDITAHDWVARDEARRQLEALRGSLSDIVIDTVLATLHKAWPAVEDRAIERVRHKRASQGGQTTAKKKAALSAERNADIRNTLAPMPARSAERSAAVRRLVSKYKLTEARVRSIASEK